MYFLLWKLPQIPITKQLVTSTEPCRSCTNGYILSRRLMSYYAGPMPAETVDAPIPAAYVAPSGSMNTNW